MLHHELKKRASFLTKKKMRISIIFLSLLPNNYNCQEKYFKWKFSWGINYGLVYSDSCDYDLMDWVRFITEKNYFKLHGEKWMMNKASQQVWPCCVSFDERKSVIRLKTRTRLKKGVAEVQFIPSSLRFEEKLLKLLHDKKSESLL